MDAVHTILLVETCVVTALAVVATYVCARALVHVLTTRVDAFPAADARTKVFWAVVLTLCTALSAWNLWSMATAVALALVVPFPPMMLLGLIAATVGCVYLADTRRRIEGVVAHAQTPGRLW